MPVITRGHTSVMANRRDEESSKGLFCTPPWATRALIEEIIKRFYGDVSGQTVWEPACGKGHMSVPLAEHFARVFSTDLVDYGFGDGVLDFTFADAEDAPWPVDWVIFNPPFPLAEAFARTALTIARVGVAALVRLAWQEGEERYRLIWRENTPTYFCPFAERVPIIEGVWDPEAGTATAYAWAVWRIGQTPEFPPLVHISPGQARRRSKLSDLALATPGEAKRRRLAREQKAETGPDLFGGGDG
ncbi:hypothetical protein GGD81_001357 [Rhodobium orientis]|uniref:SAM-dependent DNA methyltransferase n=1 Tax=Rhodobium orientis TaxID=34017 RepID=UPI0011B93E2F|nr:SAM-dependent DNA methyltransferase [Rhodobium orientis]MBB4302330.1 hypothetical protein [Rhodobium orientis]